jgi:predicted nucleic acid-binding protein
MNLFLFDASALVKRYAPETGAALVDHLFARAARARLLCLMLGAAEVAAALIRKRNGGQLSAAMFTLALAGLRAEIVDAADFLKLPVMNGAITAAFPLLEKYPINSTDAVVLRLSLEAATQLRPTGDDLVLVASDKRLLKAGQAESLATFDPETQTQAALDTLIGP